MKRLTCGAIATTRLPRATAPSDSGTSRYCSHCAHSSGSDALIVVTNWSCRSRRRRGWCRSAKVNPGIPRAVSGTVFGAIAYSQSYVISYGTIVPGQAMTIKLNGDPHDIPQPLSVSALLVTLAIDARRVAVEHNLAVVKKAAYDTSIVRDGDEVEIVNFVGGG